MDLRLRYVASHTLGGKPGAPLDFALSSQTARLVTACGNMLIDQDTSLNAIRTSIRTSSQIDKVFYVGGGRSFLVFMDNGRVASYAERLASLQLVDEKEIVGIERTVRLGQGSYFGKFALFCKAESPSLWCLPIDENGKILEAYKLRSDIEGDQDNINFVGGVVAKMRGKVTTKAKSRICPIVAVAVHPSLSLAAAAYTNGIVRVWDVVKKQQRSHFDAQLLMSEKIVNVALHPVLPIVVICTSHGRIMTFIIKSVLYKRGDEPVLATSKTKDRKRRFQAMCFTHGSPTYLMLLTVSRRIIVRMINKEGLIVNSTRYAKSSKTLPLRYDTGPRGEYAMEADYQEEKAEMPEFAVLKCEPGFGLIAASFGSDEKVFIFQTTTSGLSSIRPPLSSGLSTGFSTKNQMAFTGPVTVASDSLIAHRGALFIYTLEDNEVSKICDLPPGDVSRVEVARDPFGYCCAALIFYIGDEEFYPTQVHEENECCSRYVLCTRRGEGEAWNVSEPNEGRAGCFLNVTGMENSIIILANTGTVVSLSSFAITSNTQGVPSLRRGRGVQRFKLDGQIATQMFRTPFASWTAVLYYSSESREVCLSKNASYHQRFSNSNISEGSISAAMTDLDFHLDKATALRLRERERVVDVRWQQLPSKSNHETYLGAVMTEKRIYFVRDMLLPLSVFEFQRLDQMGVPFSLPSFAWVGPFVTVLTGNLLLSVSPNGRADTVAGISCSQNASALVAALPDRIVYARPCPNRTATALSVSTRPYGALSGSLRGVLSLSDMAISSNLRTTEQVKRILELQDVSQCSVELMKTLLANSMSSIAYLLAISPKSRLSVPPIRRAMFLGRMGYAREAFVTIEEQCSRLSHANALHSGSELFRILQKLLNIAFATRDFALGQRCSMLLGRKGTFAAFVDVEGGYAAVKSLMDHTRAIGNKELTKMLRPWMEKSSQSSTATDSSIFPSRSGMDKIPETIALGESSVTDIFVCSRPTSDGDGSSEPASRIEISKLVPSDINKRLELSRRDIDFGPSDYATVYADLSDDTETKSQNVSADLSAAFVQVDARGHDDSSDEEAMFQIQDEETLEISAGGMTGQVASSKDTRPSVVDIKAEETRRSIQALKETTTTPVEEARQNTHDLMRAQRLAVVDGQTVSSLRANEMMKRGGQKLEEGRYSSAQKHFESALRGIAGGQERGQRTSPDLINQLVYYRLFAQVRTAMEDIRSSAHSNTAAGRITYTQLATALTALPLQKKHRIETLVMAADANMMTSNFGTAAHALQAIKEIGVPEAIRPVLRDKYAMCAAKGFANASQEVIPRLCYRTLQTFKPGLLVLSCSVCPAKFLPDPSLSSTDNCPACGCGTIRRT